jgi:hypothetical protein
MDEIEESRKKIELAISANGGDIHRKNWCQCDPTVGYSPCEYCAVFNGLNEGKKLLSALEKERNEADRREKIFMEIVNKKSELQDHFAKLLEATKPIVNCRDIVCFLLIRREIREVLEKIK